MLVEVLPNSQDPSTVSCARRFLLKPDSLKALFDSQPLIRSNIGRTTYVDSTPSQNVALYLQYFEEVFPLIFPDECCS